jgi:hypothetical protein
MTGAQLLALGHAALVRSHQLILLGGALGLLSILAGVISRRVGAPVLLVFLALGMLAGDEHVLGIPYDNFTSAYLIGSVALAVILFEGGLKTPVSMLRLAFWPAAVLATIGVGVTAGILGAAVSLIGVCLSRRRCWPVRLQHPPTLPRSRCCCGAPVLRCRSDCLRCSKSSPGSTTRCRCS